MSLHEKILITNSLEKAMEAIKSAESNINNDFLLNAQNRIYYSIFYAVLALGYLEDFITGKHQELMGWFNREFINNRKTFDKNLSKIYKRLYDNRKRFDYDVMKFPDKEGTIQDLNDAILFVDTLKNYINNELDKI